MSTPGHLRLQPCPRSAPRVPRSIGRSSSSVVLGLSVCRNCSNKSVEYWQERQTCLGNVGTTIWGCRNMLSKLQAQISPAARRSGQGLLAWSADGGHHRATRCSAMENRQIAWPRGHRTQISSGAAPDENFSLHVEAEQLRLRWANFRRDPIPTEHRQQLARVMSRPLRITIVGRPQWNFPLNGMDG